MSKRSLKKAARKGIVSTFKQRVHAGLDKARLALMGATFGVDRHDASEPEHELVVEEHVHGDSCNH